MTIESGDGYGRVAWEVLDTATGEVTGGRRDLQVGDIEVMVYPPPTRPQFNLLRLGPRKIAADALGWLVKGGRGSTRKQVRLGDECWLILPTPLRPVRPSIVALSARREGGRVSCWELFEVDDDGTSAAKVEETGSLGLEWAPNSDGFPELATTTFRTDVSLRLKPAKGPIGRDPAWRLRILAGSQVRWPSADDGIQLVPRLRPSFGAG